MGHGALAELHHPPGSASAMAARACQTTHRQFRARNQFALAYRAGHSSAELEPRYAANPEQLALRAGLLPPSAGTRMGAKNGGSAETPMGEPLMLIGVDRAY